MKKLYNSEFFCRGDYIPLSKEEKKIHKLTQCNTVVNRDMLDKRDIYLTSVESDYRDIYGTKGVKFYNNMKNQAKKSPINKKNVKFSHKIQYSKN